MNNDIKLIAKEIAKMGRGGDTMLAHITPEEARLLYMMGGAGTKNPYTGLPEFRRRRGFMGFIQRIIPVAVVVIAIVQPQIIPMIGQSILGGGASTLAATAAGSAAVAGATTLASGGDLETAARNAALAAVTVGVGGNVGRAVSDSMAAAGASTAVASAAGNIAGSAAGAIATGRDPAAAVTNAAINIAANTAYNTIIGSGQPPAPVETRDVTAAAPRTEDIIARTAADIVSTPTAPIADIAAAPPTTVTDVTAPTITSSTAAPTSIPITELGATPITPVDRPAELIFDTTPTAGVTTATRLPASDFTFTPPIEALLPTPSAPTAQPTLTPRDREVLDLITPPAATAPVEQPTPPAVAPEPIVTPPPVAEQPPVVAPPVFGGEPIVTPPIAEQPVPPTTAIPGITPDAGELVTPPTAPIAEVTPPPAITSPVTEPVAPEVTPPTTETELAGEMELGGGEGAGEPTTPRRQIRIPRTSDKTSARRLASTRLFEPVSLTGGLAPIERTRKEMEDEESLEEPTGTWGSRTLRGLLGI